MVFPQLVFLSGPLHGQSLPVTGDAITLGREETNSVVLNHASVSRKHCRIERTDEGILLSDLESKNGTFVNGVPVPSALLEHGTEIRIGSVRMLFLDREEQTPSEFLNDEPVAGESTIYLRESDLLYTRENRDGALAERLSQLLNLATTLSQIGTLEEFAPALFPALLAALPFRRAAVVLGADAAEISGGWFWVRDTGPVPALRLSRTILREALVDHNFMLRSDLLPDSAPSLMAEGIRALICVPLLRPGRVLGALYLDSSDSRKTLTEEHLQFASAAAGIAALTLDNLRKLETLREENRFLKQEVLPPHGIVGSGAAMRHVYDFIRKAAAADSTVLVLGESGSGKELVARAIHNTGSRSGASFVAVNCAALTESLLESDLFGHEKGAFTGAVQQHKGKFERAHGGTLFLDEVFELTPAIQAKLLRVLQEREFERVGGSRPIRVDVRVIAATHRDLKEEVKKAAFREDLYYRLNVLSVRVPPLREHPEDIPLLASHFLARSCERMHRPAPGISEEARACLLRYSWPGNVRELENAIERAVVLSESGTIDPEDLPESVIESAPAEGGALARYHEAVTETKSKVILDAIRAAKGNLTEAARALGVNSNYLHRLIRNLNLRSKIQKG